MPTINTPRYYFTVEQGKERGSEEGREGRDRGRVGVSEKHIARGERGIQREGRRDKRVREVRRERGREGV